MRVKAGVRFLINHLLMWGKGVNALERILLFAVALILKPFVSDGKKRMLYLEQLQARGISALPARYFEPVPLVKDVRLRTEHLSLVMDDWKDTSFDEQILRLTEDAVRVDAYKQKFAAICDNKMFNSLDLIACDLLVEKVRPKRVIEIGAGYSTCAFLLAMNGSGTITSIEPYPSEFLRNLASANPAMISLIEKKIQDFQDGGLFASLEAGDILFIDSTHVCNIGGDLPHIFGRILPSLRSGVVVHVHDVALPYEYPESLIYRGGRLYNEQYLLAPLIAHGAYMPIFGVYRFLAKRRLWLSNSVDRFLNRGASFWMTKA